MTTNKTSFLNPNVVAFIIPLVLISALIVLLNSAAFATHQHVLAKFVTIDFIITIPLIYFLLIRRTKISNLTIAPVLIACIMIASYTIPAVNQDILTLAKTWLIPIVELSVLTFVVLKVRKAIKQYKKTADNHSDFYSALTITCESLFPKTAAKLAANEIALIYYGFFNFKKITLKPNEFSNYKGSGILSTLGAIIFVVAIEMVTIHLLAAKWNTVLAWVLTGLSFYSALQLIGIIRSVPKRPIAIHDDYLQLRFGILSETNIPYESIETIEIVNASDYDNNKAKDTKTLSLLGELEHSNVYIELKTPQHLSFFYGKPKAYSKLYLFVDDQQRFKSEVDMHLSK